MEKKEIEKISFKILLFSILISFFTGYFYFRKYEVKEYKLQISKLLDDIYQKSYEKNFKGTLSELKEIKGPEKDETINSLFINEIKMGFLSKDSPYILIIEPSEFEKEIKELKESLKSRNVSDETISDIIIRKTRKAIKVPDYRAELKWNWEDKSNGYIRLNFKISSVNFIESSVVITHPEYEKNYYAKKEFFKVLFYIFSLISAVSMLIIIYLEMGLFLLKKKLIKNITGLKETVENYVRDGSFVAAYNEIEKFLKYLPDNSDLISLKENLMVKTNNNPEKAERMYRDYKNIEAKVRGRGKVKKEDLDDLKEINKSIPFEGIAEVIGKIERIIEENETKEKSFKAKQLIKEGKLEEAESLIENINYLPRTDEEKSEKLIGFEGELKEINESIEKIRKDSEKIFNEAMDFLKSGEIKKAKDLLKSAVEKNKNLDEARKILNEIEKSKDSEKYFLTPAKTEIGKKIFIFKKKELTLFRKDKKEPDIELNFQTVSRDAHLEIALIMNQIIAQDQNSKNGTKIAGEIIRNNSKIAIDDGYVLDFNGAYQMTAHIYKGGIFNQKTVMVGQETVVPGIINKKDKSEILSAVFEGSDDRIFIILISKVPIKFSSIGITYDNSSDIFICNDDGVCFIKFPDSETGKATEIIYPGKEIEYKGVCYIVRER